MKSLKSFLVPTAAVADLRKAGWLALAGTLIAGIFGILHDQITYTISPEYFTRMKFDQFHAWDFGFPRRMFVAEIGFLATWWVGLIGSWFLARIAVRKFSHPQRAVLSALVFVLAMAVLFGASGYFWGNLFAESSADWDEGLASMKVKDATAFNRVAGIHLGSYLGAFVGLLLAMAWFFIRPKSRISSME